MMHGPMVSEDLGWDHQDLVADTGKVNNPTLHVWSVPTPSPTFRIWKGRLPYEYIIRSIA